MGIMIAICTVVLVVVNAMATRLVIADALSDTSQRIAQIAAIWSLPVLGAIFIFGIHRRTEPPPGVYAEAPDILGDKGSTAGWLDHDSENNE